MKIKKIILSTFFLFTLIPNGISGENEEYKKKLENKIKSNYLNELKSKISNWSPLTELNIEQIEANKPEYSIKTLIPLLDDLKSKNINFFQGSLYRHDGGKRHTFNLGYGYRVLSKDKKKIVGTNFFYDNEFPHNHQQVGLGFELKSSVIDFNSNYYKPITKWKTGENSKLERGMKGHSFELGGQVPYIPSAKIFLKNSKRYAIEQNNDLKTNTISLFVENFIYNGLDFEAGYNDKNNRQDTHFLRLNYKINSNNFERNKSNFISKNVFNFENIESRKYEKVRRENKIIKEVKNSISCDGLCFKIKGTL